MAVRGLGVGEVLVLRVAIGTLVAEDVYPPDAAGGLGARDVRGL